ncbi:hypothetical protein PL78_07615 [Yersinia entomophaga]|uniref:Uncharacterized protein n=1 Tax=Yersinia entomophaga TaxID=935293 RepID=A0ABM6BJP3_YERET|nr:hypothetical protein PL78_07615 [Yersinia entomophaga]
MAYRKNVSVMKKFQAQCKSISDIFLSMGTLSVNFLYKNQGKKYRFYRLIINTIIAIVVLGHKMTF